MVKAAVLYEQRKPLVIEDLELDDPKDREVLIKVGAAGHPFIRLFVRSLQELHHRQLPSVRRTCRCWRLHVRRHNSSTQRRHSNSSFW